MKITASHAGADGLWPVEEHRAEWQDHQRRVAGWLMMPFDLYSDDDLRRWRSIWSPIAMSATLSAVRDEAAENVRRIDARLAEIAEQT